MQGGRMSARLRTSSRVSSRAATAAATAASAASGAMVTTPRVPRPVGRPPGKRGLQRRRLLSTTDTRGHDGDRDGVTAAATADPDSSGSSGNGVEENGDQAGQETAAPVAPDDLPPLPLPSPPPMLPRTRPNPVVMTVIDELEERANDLAESWETESLFQDVFMELNDRPEGGELANADVCTPQEANRLRQELRILGPTEFCIRTVDAGRYTAKKMLTAFGLRPPSFMSGAEDAAYLHLLCMAMSRELSKRAKITRFNSVDDAASLIGNARHIICLTGAGISTSLGIPDFRSKGTGLYSKLEHLGLSDPQEVFDITVFREDPTIFYSVAKDILPSTNRFTPTHRFIAMLQERAKLLTNYSQNIDNLEEKAGILPEKLVQCHGSFATATCVRCGHRVRGEDIFADIRAERIPRCLRCIQRLRASAAAGGPPMKRKRSGGSFGIGGIEKQQPPQEKQEQGLRRSRRVRLGARSGSGGLDDTGSDGDSEYDFPQAGVMKPDITFFGEALPEEFSRRLTEVDRDLVDLVIVIGTSLKVTPVSEIVSWLPPHIPQIYISRQPVSHINFDIDLLGDCDTVVTELCRRLGWPMEHEMVPADLVIRVTNQDGFPNRHLFEATSAAGATGGPSKSDPTVGAALIPAPGAVPTPASAGSAAAGKIGKLAALDGRTRAGRRAAAEAKAKIAEEKAEAEAEVAQPKTYADAAGPLNGYGAADRDPLGQVWDTTNGGGG